MLLPRVIVIGALAISSLAAQTYTYDADGVLKHVDYGSTNRVRYAFDPGGNLLSVDGPTQLEVWRHQNFGTLDSEGAAADNAVTANDGVPNLVKYALGLAPRERALPSDVSELVKTPKGLEFYYWARTGDDNLTVQVQRSSNLATWSTEGIASELIGVEGPLNLFRALDVSSGSKQFLRLKIEYKP